MTDHDTQRNVGGQGPLLDPALLRNESLALWAAELLGMQGEQAQDFAADMFQDQEASPGDDEVIAAVKQSLATRGVTVASEEIQVQMKRLMNDVMEELR